MLSIIVINDGRNPITTNNKGECVLNADIIIIVIKSNNANIENPSNSILFCLLTISILFVSIVCFYILFENYPRFFVIKRHKTKFFIL